MSLSELLYQTNPGKGRNTTEIVDWDVKHLFKETKQKSKQYIYYYYFVLMLYITDSNFIMSGDRNIYWVEADLSRSLSVLLKDTTQCLH